MSSVLCVVCALIGELNVMSTAKICLLIKLRRQRDKQFALHLTTHDSQHTTINIITTQTEMCSILLKTPSR